MGLSYFGGRNSTGINDLCDITIPIKVTPNDNQKDIDAYVDK